MQNVGMQKMKKKTILKIALGAVIVAALVYATIKLFPIIKSGEIVEIIRGYGGWGVVIFLGVQLLQIFAAFLPGEPVEIAAGVLFGAWWGLVLCLLGIFLGTVIIYYGVRMFGAKSVENDPRFEKWKFLKNPDTAFRLVFILFLIPGTPKDILTYFGPFVPIKPRKFIMAAVFGRIPSIITSTLSGAALYDGNIKMSIIYFAIGAVLAAIGLFVNKKLEDRLGKEKKEENESKDSPT